MIAVHLGVAAAVHSIRRDTSLPWLLGAAMAPDVVDGLFVLARSCNPNGLYSHTIPAAVLIAAVTGAIAFFATGQRATGVCAVGLVLAHLPPDYVTGRKLFWPGAELQGLRLYDWPSVDFALEASLAVAAWVVLRSRPWAPRWAVGRRALLAVLALQLTIDVAGKMRGGIKPSACARVSTTAD